MFRVSYKDNDYEISEFLDDHPGGRSIIERYKDKDITKAFGAFKHSDYAKSKLETFKINKSRDVQPNTDAKPNTNVQPNTNVKIVKQKLSWQFLKEKLFTKEDNKHIHKFFGCLSLISFIYRYFYVFPLTGTLGFTGTLFDYITVFIHFMLSFSSLIFHVVEKRILSNPLIIYEEYRLHAIVFTLKSVFLILYGFCYQYLNQIYASILLSLCVIFFHLTADLITVKYGTKGITTVRNTNDGSIYWVKLFYSWYQVLTFASQLFVCDKLSDLGYNGLIAIQSSAFLMTLKRKSIIRSRTHVFWYTFALLLSMLYTWHVKGIWLFIEIAILFAIRIKFNMSKYTTWLIYALIKYIQA